MKHRNSRLLITDQEFLSLKISVPANHMPRFVLAQTTRHVRQKTFYKHTLYSKKLHDNRLHVLFVTYRIMNHRRCANLFNRPRNFDICNF